MQLCFITLLRVDEKRQLSFYRYFLKKRTAFDSYCKLQSQHHMRINYNYSDSEMNTCYIPCSEISPDFWVEVSSISISGSTLESKNIHATYISCKATQKYNLPLARRRASSKTVCLVCFTTKVSNRASSTRERRLAG